MKNVVSRLLSRSLLFGVLPLLVIGAMSARAQETAPVIKAPTLAVPAPPAAPAGNVPLIVLPFQMVDKWIVLTMPLLQSGSGEPYLVSKDTRPLRLILDSGADSSLLAQEAFTDRKIRLPPPKQGEDSYKIEGVGNDKAPTARQLSDIKYAAGDTSFNDTPLLAPLGEWYQGGIDGFLGAGVFFACVVEVDYAQKIVRFFDPTKFSPPAPNSGFTRVPLQRIAGSNGVTVPVDVTAFGFVKTTAQMKVDTGHTTTLYFRSPFVKRNKWEVFAPRTIETQSMGMGGVSNSRTGRLKEVSFGGVTLNAPLVDFSFDTKGSMTNSDSDGLIGGGVLSRFTVIFDYTHASLYLRPNADVHAPFVYQKFGFGTAPAPSASGGWLIGEVSTDGAIARVGVKKGEYLFAVDKKDIGKLTEAEFSRLLDARTGERVFTVGDAKGEEKRDVRVTPIAL